MALSKECNVPLSRRVIPISKDWTFRQGNDSFSQRWPVSNFPTNVHLDLLHHGIISDPFHDKNENDCQWVGEVPWVYQTAFMSPDLGAGKAILAFDGLDTYATVKLNQKQILETENMFIPERVDVTKLLIPKGQNVLEINFASAFLIGKKLVEKHPSHRWGCWNGDPSRLAIRKAQYHYGWDWGPKLMTCGPWRPVSLEVYTSRISDLFFSTHVSSSLDSAEIVAKADVDGKSSHVRFDIFFQGAIEATETVRIVDSFATATFHRDNPSLWYPAGYGEQHLYSLKATLLLDTIELDAVKKRFGLRRAQVIQRELKDAAGTSFIFRINDVPIFCGGSCWIPAESFLPRMTAQKYRDWVKLAVDGNQVMIRAWAGGIYEEQAFYDACDEMGVLVWQDFLFACGNYPANQHFLELVRREAVANVKLLRHHPSIVIFAGNNEDYQYCETEHLGYDPSDQNPRRWLKTTFPARFIYEKLLKEVTDELAPDTFYHFGSPYGGSSTTDRTIGDIHQWNVWHGTQSPYQEFDRLCGRFVSEFGMEAFPSPRTIDSFLPRGSRDPERYPQSSTMDFHNKAAGHERRLATYLTENLQYTFKPFEQYVYATQLLQAECLGTAYRLFRRQWKGPGKEYCAGALCWQLNDCWPVTSWSIVDYYLRPKLGYYAVKRGLAPITVGTKRITSTPSSEKAKHFLEIWASNLTLEDRKIQIEMRMWDIPTGALLDHLSLSQQALILSSNRSTEIAKVAIPTHDLGEGSIKDPYRIVAAVVLINHETGQQITRTISWPEPLKYVRFQQPKALRIKSLEGGVEVSADVPVKGVMLDVPEIEGRDPVIWDDNGFDVMPDEHLKVGAQGLMAEDEERIDVRYMGSEGECIP